MSRAVASFDRIVKNTGAQDKEELAYFLAHEGLPHPRAFLDDIMAELAEENHRRDMIEIDLKVRLAMAEEARNELCAKSVEWKGMEDIKKENKFLKKYFNEAHRILHPPRYILKEHKGDVKSAFLATLKEAANLFKAKEGGQLDDFVRWKEDCEGLL